MGRGQTRTYSFNLASKVDAEGQRTTSVGSRLGWLARAAALFCAILLLFISTPQGHPAAGGVGSNPTGTQSSGELTVGVHATGLFKAVAEDPIHARDEQSITYEGTTRYKWTFWDHRSHLEVISFKSNVSVSGGGSASLQNVMASKWTYTSGGWDPKQVMAAVFEPDFDWEGGRIEVWSGFLGLARIQWDCLTTVDGKAEEGVCHNLLPSPSPLFDPSDESSFVKGLVKTVKREADSFHVNGDSSWSGTMLDLRYDANLGGAVPSVFPKATSDTSQVAHADFHVTYSVDFTAGGEDQDEVELIPAPEYDQWLPQAGEDESTLGNFIDVQIVAHKKGDPNADPPKKITKYTIELEDTSREKGVDLNWPPKDKAKDDFDMKIDKDNPWISMTDGNNAQKAETKQEGLTQFKVTVNSYDWGGYTKLHVTAELKDGSSVVGHVHGHADQDFLLIPKDDNLNHIADWWEHWFKIENADASADDDDQPHSDAGKGDSIALYDEYRGFHIHGRHERLSPEIKDLFVWDPRQLGVGIYGVTGINVHMISVDEFDFKSGAHNPCVVTPNGSHGDVYAIHLTKGPIEKGVVGETEGGPGVPHDIEKVVIDPNEIAGAYGDNAAAELQSTIAHELSHATNVLHHGETPPDYDIGDALCRVPDKSGRPGTIGTLVTVNLPCNKTPRDKNGKAIGPGQPASDCYEVAAKGGKYSGNDQCWMRYDMTNFYEDPAGNCQWQHNGKTVHGSKYRTDPPGMTLCESPDGTGVNDPKNPHNKAGNASPGHGDCKNQLRLK
jgi:hypothetical protein